MQFNHRMLAYLIFVLAILHAVDVVRTARGGHGADGRARARLAPSRCRPRSASLTLLHAAPLPLALLHQAMAVVVLAVAVLHAERLSARKVQAPTRRDGLSS